MKRNIVSLRREEVITHASRPEGPAKIIVNTLQNLKESKQLNKKWFLGVIGRRTGFRASKWSQINQYGAKRIPKRNQKVIPKRAKWSHRYQKCAKRRSTNKKTMFRKGRLQDVSPNSNYSAQILFSGFMLQHCQFRSQNRY